MISKRISWFRIVIFSKFSIVNVNVSIDGKYLGMASQSIDNQNLFVLPWNTSLYKDDNLHEISVEIQVGKRRRRINSDLIFFFWYFRTREIIQ